MRRFHVKRTLPLFLAALPLALAMGLGPLMAQEVMYRWTDAQGTVHYGQVPPSGVDAERIITSAPRGDRAPQERLDRALGEMEERQQQARSEQEERERQAASERIRRENCDRARANLETLTERGGRVTIRENDQYRVLEEEERQAMIEQTRAQIREFCRE
jgi:hypothetical protein